MKSTQRSQVKRKVDLKDASLAFKSCSSFFEGMSVRLQLTGDRAVLMFQILVNRRGSS